MQPQEYQPAASEGKLAVRVEFGRRWLSADQVAGLRRGSLVELDAGADGPVGVFVNGRLVARGAAIVVDGKLGVYVKETVCSTG